MLHSRSTRLVRVLVLASFFLLWNSWGRASASELPTFDLHRFTSSFPESAPALTQPLPEVTPAVTAEPPSLAAALAPTRAATATAARKTTAAPSATSKPKAPASTGNTTGTPPRHRP